MYSTPVQLQSIKVKLGDKEDFDKEQIGVKATISHDQLSIYW